MRVISDLRVLVVFASKPWYIRHANLLSLGFTIEYCGISSLFHYIEFENNILIY